MPVIIRSTHCKANESHYNVYIRESIRVSIMYTVLRTYELIVYKVYSIKNMRVIRFTVVSHNKFLHSDYKSEKITVLIRPTVLRT